MNNRNFSSFIQRERRAARMHLNVEKTCNFTKENVSVHHCAWFRTLLQELMFGVFHPMKPVFVVFSSDYYPTSPLPHW